MLGELGVVRNLLNRGVNVEAQTANGETALIAASFEGHLGIVRLLLDQGLTSKVSIRKVLHP